MKQALAVLTLAAAIAIPAATAASSTPSVAFVTPKELR